MKKTWKLNVLVALCIACVLATLMIFAACDGKNEDKPTEKDETFYDSLVAEEYRDYAAEVRLNTEEYPELARQGLRLVTGYDSADYAVAKEGMPDDVEVIRENFDPEKGILVIINGLQAGNGRNGNANMRSDSRLGELELFGDENEIEYFTSDKDSRQTYDLAKYWMDNCYNVFYFHWEMFADYYKSGGLWDTTSAPTAVQERVWTQDTGVQAVYQREGKTYMTEPNKAVNGSVAELLAADYMRMAAAVKEAFPTYGAGKNDVRFAGHSMGGLLTVASCTLLNLLGEAGKLESGFVPSRLALMDSYLGISNSPELTISWSGKQYVSSEDVPGNCNYVVALDMLINKFGVAAEFVCNEGFIVPFLMMAQFNEEKCTFEGMYAAYANRISELCPIVLVRPYFVGVKPSISANGHNPIREWYLSTILYDAPKADGRTVPTARMSNEDVRAAKGNFYMMSNARTPDCETVRCDDDTFAFYAMA